MVHDKTSIAGFFGDGLIIRWFVRWATSTFGKAPRALPKLSAIELHLVRCERLQDRAGRRPSAGLVR